MARIIIFLLCLLLRNNAYAYCYANQWASYGPVFSSLGVTQGTTMQACQQLACQIYPGIPECGMFLQPACSNQTEYQSLSCQPHYSGAVNQSRTYTCSSQSWGPWTTTSNNCTPDPPTCQSSFSTRTLSCQPHFSGLISQTNTVTCPDPYGSPVETGYITTSNSCAPDPATCSPSVQTQSVACPVGYNGTIIQNRSSSCSDPYGSPTWTSWSTTSDTCTMTATNLNNPTSPISPISPTNPNSVISKSMATVESVTVQDLTATAPTPSTTSGDTPKSESQSGTATTSTSQQANGTTTTSGTDKKENIKAPDVPKGKDLVPGFGIVMSMQLLNSGYNLQQEQMKEYINLIQEQEYGQQQNILLEFISANDTGNSIFNTSAIRWRGLLRDNPLQRFDLDD